MLWPRIVLARGEKKPDAETVAIARKIQQKLAAVARQSLAGAPVDVRPEPQRVCTQTGCVGVSVGALLAKVGKGCAVVALVSRPGQSPQRLVAWAGRVTLKAAEVPFRSHPEGSVGFPDFASCSSLIEQLATNDGPVVEAIREAAR